MRMLLKGLQPDTLYFVQLRTKDGGRTSPWSQMFELRSKRDEIAPNPVTNLSATFSEGNLAVYWEAPTHSADGTELRDLKDYKVTIGPVPADPEWRLVEDYTESRQFEFTKEDNVAAFGRFRAGLTITVQARDLVGNLSTPVNITKTKPRPSPVTGLTWASVGNAFSGTWTPPTTNTDGSAFTDPAGFEVKVIYATSNVRTYNSMVPKFDYSYEQNKADFGGVNNTAKSPLTLQVRAKDSVGQFSDPVSLEAGNQPPSKPTGVSAAPVSEGIRVTWTANPEDDITAYEIWSAGTLTGAGTLFGRVSASQREYIHQTVAYNQDHYLYVTAVDEFDSRSPESDRSGPHRPKSPFTVDTDPPPATTLTAATPTRAVTDPAAVTLTWPAVTASDLAGYHIRYSRATDATRSWEYYDVIDKAATSVTIEGLFSQTAYAFQIRSYDTMINPSAWSAEATATSSKSEVPPMTEISSNISVIAGGVLRSNNFNETNQTGWRLMDTSLDILSGRVNARVVSAGTLISSQNVTTDGTTQPAWSLNLAGNASLNDVQVRGKVVVGSGTNNANVSIASNNYGGTGSQWAIKGDGTIDIRHGGSTGSNLTIDSTGIRGRDGAGTQRFIVNTSGQFALSTTNGGVVFDDNGLRIYSGATVMVDLNRNGSATFEGTVRASAGGHIGGWTINPGYGMYAGNLNLRSDLGMIYGGDTTARVAMRAGHGFWAGHNDHGSAPFRVHTNGYLHSVSGYIGGWTINSDSLSGSGTISGGTVSGATVVGGNLQTGYVGNGSTSVIRLSSSYPNMIEFFSVNGNRVAYLQQSTLQASTYGRLVIQSNNELVLDCGGITQIGGSGNLELYSSTVPVTMWGPSPPKWRRPSDGQHIELSLNGHGHDYASTGHGHSGHTWTEIRLSTGLYTQSSGNNYLIVASTGTPALYFAGGGTRVGVPSGNIIYMQRNDGAVYASVYGGAYTNQSSIQSKKNVRRLEKAKGTGSGVTGKGKEKVKRLSPVAFAYTDDYADLPKNKGKQRLGLIAEEVEEIYPEAINRDEQGRPGIDYSVITTALLLAVQEQQDEIEQMRAEIDALKAG